MCSKNMIVQNMNSTRFLKVKPEVGEDTKNFIGCNKIKDSDWYKIEDCIINRIVLNKYNVQGLYTQHTVDEVVLSYPENLKDYQLQDVQKMVLCPQVANFNRMGYGKTVEACKAMRELGIKSACIVAPKSVLFQWKTQIEKWYSEKRGSVYIYNNNWTPSKNKIVLVNYEKLVNKSVLVKLQNFTWDLVIADEAHRIKNRKSKRTVAVKSIPANKHWAMTGTPITRLADDLWSILNFLGPEYSGRSYWNFVYYFCEVKQGFFGLEITGLTSNEFRLDVLHELLNYCAVINRDLGLTPGKVYETIKLKMEPKQKKLYDNTRDLILSELPEDMTIPNGAVLVTRLLQVTSNPGQWISGVAGAKFEYIKDIIKDNPDKKIVVFSKFSKTCEALHQYLKNNKINNVKYTGDEDSVTRYENKLKFIHNDGVRAIIGTIGAMGEGVDGLQDVTNIVVFIDRDWSPELVKQAEDRVNRFGQKHEVIVQFLECDQTFDQKVTSVNFKKAEDIRKALLDESVFT